MQLVAFVINYILKFLFVNTFALKKTDFFQFFVSLYFLNYNLRTGINTREQSG